jgi:hypothetical protein
MCAAKNSAVPQITNEHFCQNNNSVACSLHSSTLDLQQTITSNPTALSYACASNVTASCENTNLLAKHQM